jgi:murein DD-endopeptidase MepM/ murein hydrolase activator NlpD
MATTSKAQYAIDGNPGKKWKVTSYMGWRIHPVLKEKKHHNGTDIWSSQEPCWIEAPYDGKVVAVGNNPSGFGNSVTLMHKIKGQWYTTLYAHMANGTVKVKKGQKIEAGTPLGKMGTTGMSTGKHLHWELHKGKQHIWSATGAGYIEPVKFFKRLIEWEKSIATAPVEAKPGDPIIPTPTHDEAGSEAAEASENAIASAPTPAAPAAAPKPAAKAPARRR